MLRKLICICLILLLGALPAQAEYDVLLAVGGSFVYTRDAKGVVRVWGDNQYGQLGKGHNKQNKSPAVFKSKNQEVDTAEIKQIFAGSDYSYFLMNDGTIFGAGNNVHGELNRRNSYCSTHVKIDLPDQTIETMALGFGHTLALSSSGEVYAWGRNNAGQVGSGNRKNAGAPMKLGLKNIVKIAAGGKFSLALDSEKTLWGWGDNSHHQLTAENTTAYLEPIKLNTGDIEIVDIDAGGSFISLVDAEGKLWMRGVNDVHQLGFDSKGEDVAELRLVEELPLPVQTLASYSSQTYVILSDGSLYGWGNNTYGQLGLGFRTASGRGVTVSKILESGCKMVMGGSLCMTAVMEDGTVMAAGINKFGQLGLATREYEISAIFSIGLNLKTGETS